MKTDVTMNLTRVQLIRKLLELVILSFFILECQKPVEDGSEVSATYTPGSELRLEISDAGNPLDGASLTIPANSMDDQSTISLRVIDTVVSIGSNLSVNVIEILPSGLRFDPPASFRFSTPSSVSNESASVFFLSDHHNRIEQLVADETRNGVVTGLTYHSSLYFVADQSEYVQAIINPLKIIENGAYRFAVSGKIRSLSNVPVQNNLWNFPFWNQNLLSYFNYSDNKDDFFVEFIANLKVGWFQTESDVVYLKVVRNDDLFDVSIHRTSSEVKSGSNPVYVKTDVTWNEVIESWVPGDAIINIFHDQSSTTQPFKIELSYQVWGKIGGSLYGAVTQQLTFTGSEDVNPSALSDVEFLHSYDINENCVSDVFDDPVPTIYEPLDSYIDTTSVTVRWNYVPNDNPRFELELSSHNGMQTYENIYGDAFLLENLYYEQNYSVRVRPVYEDPNGDRYGEWSSLKFFNGPRQPSLSLISPGHGEEVGIPVHLTWESWGDALGYYVIVNSSESGGSSSFEPSSPELLLDESIVEHGAEYNWRVAAILPQVYPEDYRFSEISGFQTVSNYPNLHYPVGGVTTEDLDLYFNWSIQSNYLAHFELYDHMDVLLLDSCLGLGAEGIEYSLELFDTEYSWRVRGESPEGIYTNWSPLEFFITPPILFPHLANYETGDTLQDGDLEINYHFRENLYFAINSWRIPDSLRLVVSSIGSPSNTVVDTMVDLSHISGSQRTVSIEVDSLGPEEYSFATFLLKNQQMFENPEVNYLVFQDLRPTQSPELTQPANGAFVVASDATIAFESVPSATQHTLEVTIMRLMS